jgi:hypothetical protein
MYLMLPVSLGCLRPVSYVPNVASVSHTKQGEDNPETLATLGAYDTGRRQPRDTGNIRYIRHRAKTTQRHWQHYVHTTQGEDNPETLATLGTYDTGRTQPRDTGNIRYRRHRAKTTQRHWQCLCVVCVLCRMHLMLPVSLGCLRPVSYVPNVASVSGLSSLCVVCT